MKRSKRPDFKRVQTISEVVMSGCIQLVILWVASIVANRGLPIMFDAPFPWCILNRGFHQVLPAMWTLSVALSIAVVLAVPVFVICAIRVAIHAVFEPFPKDRDYTRFVHACYIGAFLVLLAAVWAPIAGLLPVTNVTPMP